MTVRPKKTNYETVKPTERALFITAADDEGNYPLEGHGCNVMYCRFLNQSKVDEDNQEDDLIYDLTQSSNGSDSRFALVYVGTWVPQGEIIKAYKIWGRWWGRWDCRTLMSIRKYDAERNLHWHYTIPGVWRSSSDVAESEDSFEEFDSHNIQGFVSVKVGSDGSVYALHNEATYRGSLGELLRAKPRLVKFDPYGELLATVFISDLQEGRQIDLDDDDNVYVVGVLDSDSINPTGVFQSYLQKFDSDLNLIKVASDTEATNQINHVVVKDGKVYIGCDSIASLFGTNNPVIRVFDLDLELQDTFYYPGSTFAHVRGIAVDDSGNVYASSSQVFDTDTSTDYGNLQKFTPTGVVQWNHTLGEERYFQPIHYRDDHIYVYANIDQTFRKYTIDGVQVWSVPIVTWDDEENDYSSLFLTMYSIDSDADGNLYVAGTHYEVGETRLPLNVQKFSPDGERLWRHEIRRNQTDIAVNQTTGEFYTVGSVVEDDC